MSSPRSEFLVIHPPLCHPFNDGIQLYPSSSALDAYQLIRGRHRLCLTMPHHTTTVAILAAVVIMLFVYQYAPSTVDLESYRPASPNSAKFGLDVEGLTSNIQDADDLDWDDLPEEGGDLLNGEGDQIASIDKRKVKVDLGVMSRCPDAVSGDQAECLPLESFILIRFPSTETLRSGHG